MKRIRIGHDYEIGVHQPISKTIGTLEIVIYRFGASDWAAFERYSPVYRIDLINASIDDGFISLSNPELSFSVKTGECVKGNEEELLVLQLSVERSELFVTLVIPEQVTHQMTCLAKYGADGRIGRFWVPDHLEIPQRMIAVAETARGVERVELLEKPKYGFDGIVTGTIIHSEYATYKSQCKSKDDLQQLSNAVEKKLSAVPNSYIILELESLLDGTVIIHTVGELTNQLGVITAELAQETGVAFSFNFCEFAS